MENLQNIRIAGLGGMGVLKATLILGEVLFRSGYDVKKAEVHGMAQRGGSVSSDVRFGKNVKSPMIPAGKVDALLSLEPEWSDEHIKDLRKDGIIISAKDFDISKLPSAKALNVAALGRLSLYLKEIQTQTWEKVLHEVFPEKLWTSNDTAFKIGRNEI